MRKRLFTFLLLAACLALPAGVHAEEDGNEFLAYMRNKDSREMVMGYIDAARLEWNERLFCITGDDPQTQAFDAVRQYLETHPDELFRPRRYLIIQGLRTGFPCKKS